MDHQLQPATTSNVALIVGVTGMVGVSLVEALKKPTAPGAPWVVYGAARRPLPGWFPAPILDGYVQFDALRPSDAMEKLSPLSGRVTHLFWVALQALESEEANNAANTAMLANVLDALASPPGSRLRHVCLQTGTKHYMGPIFEPAYARAFTPLEPPFREDYPRLPFPCFYYDQEDLLVSRSHVFTWSIHRSSIIFGASSRSIYNMLLTLATYAAICRHEGAPFRFPGTAYAWGHFCDASDAGLLAEQQIWAATTEAARNQAFNCTNGDVFTWKGLWRALAEVFAVEFVPFSPDSGSVSERKYISRIVGVYENLFGIVDQVGDVRNMAIKASHGMDFPYFYTFLGLYGGGYTIGAEAFLWMPQYKENVGEEWNSPSQRSPEPPSLCCSSPLSQSCFSGIRAALRACRHREPLHTRL